MRYVSEDGLLVVVLADVHIQQQISQAPILIFANKRRCFGN